MPSLVRVAVLGLVTVLLTAMVVGGASLWLDRPTQLVIAVGPVDSPEQRFAARLASVLEQSRASVHLGVVAHDNPGQAAASFARHEADLAILRTDGKIPAHARAVAVLEHEDLLIVGPRNRKLKSTADLRGKKLAVVADEGNNDPLIRRLLDQYEIDGRPAPARLDGLDRLLGSGAADFALVVEPISRLAGTRSFDQLAERLGGLNLYGVGESKAVERKVPGLFADTINAGLMSGAPPIPAEDLETISRQKVLVAYDRLADSTVVELMRVLFENRGQLAVEQTFASRIDPADTEKGAFLQAHDAVAQYVDDEVKDFFDRYSDLIYLTLSVGGVIGSLGYGLAVSLLSPRRRRVSERLKDVLAIRDKALACHSDQELDQARSELDRILDEVLVGLGDGTLSGREIDAFRLGYERTRDLIDQRRRPPAAIPGLRNRL